MTNETENLMTAPNVDPIERLLQEHAPVPVPDNGFSMQVMQRLPKRTRLIAWPIALGTLFGLLACCLFLSPAILPQNGLRHMLYGRMTSSTLILLAATALMSLLAIAWTLSEADDPSEKALLSR